jgi:hypothetical protein
MTIMQEILIHPHQPSIHPSTHPPTHPPTHPSNQAKVVAMTCTHAALKRREFLNLAFK